MDPETAKKVNELAQNLKSLHMATTMEEAIETGYLDRLHIIEFKDLVSYPEDTMKKIYKFLDIKYFNHNYNYVEQTTHENDYFHNFPELHKIKNKIQPYKVSKETISLLGSEAFFHYSDNEFWRRLKNDT